MAARSTYISATGADFAQFLHLLQVWLFASKSKITKTKQAYGSVKVILVNAHATNHSNNHVRDMTLWCVGQFIFYLLFIFNDAVKLSAAQKNFNLNLILQKGDSSNRSPRRANTHPLSECHLPKWHLRDCDPSPWIQRLLGQTAGSAALASTHMQQGSNKTYPGMPPSLKLAARVCWRLTASKK